MKKTFKKFLIISIIIGMVLSLLLFCTFQFKPIGDIVFSICLGSRYRKAGETLVQVAGKNETLSIYKAKNKPFLILGPYRFDEDYCDFFFVNRAQVIRTATDKGGDAWARIANQIFMLDDMTGNDRLRAPYWDDLQCDDNSSVYFDHDAGTYIYSFHIDAGKVPVSFSISAELFTIDMAEAHNATLDNSTD